MLSTTAESAIQSGEYTPRYRPSRLTNTLICATLTACLGAVSFGYVLGYPSPIQKDLKEKLGWNSEHVTWFDVSLMYICIKLRLVLLINIYANTNIDITRIYNE